MTSPKNRGLTGSLHN